MSRNGDLMYSNQSNSGMRKHRGMPPSRNTVWAESTLTEEELSERWKQAFGNNATSKELSGKCECTCNSREEHKDGKHYIVEDFCEKHGAAHRKEIVVTDLAKKLPNRDKQKFKRFLTSYGDTDIREVMNRNS